MLAQEFRSFMDSKSKTLEFPGSAEFEQEILVTSLRLHHIVSTGDFGIWSKVEFHQGNPKNK